MKSVDLNADLGEGCGNDKEILKYVSSVNIACGLHAGSPLIMTETVIMAIKKGISIGAHPGYPDREGFGRVKIDMPYNELLATIIYQIGALNAIIGSEGGKLSHVKAHGALYNSAAKDRKIAQAVVTATRTIDAKLCIFGPGGSALETEAKKQSIRFCSEVFADRAYMNDGSLVPRSEPGAIIEDKILCAKRVLLMIEENYVEAINGERIEIVSDTVCLHGDNEKAVEFASCLHNTLTTNNIMISPIN
jgi:UPF0271 protein